MSSRHHRRIYQQMVDIVEPMDDSSDGSNQTWLHENFNPMQLKRSEMNELIMDYLVHEGFKEAAERFRKEAGIEPANLVLPNEKDQQQQPATDSNSNITTESFVNSPNATSITNNNNINRLFEDNINDGDAEMASETVKHRAHSNTKIETTEMMDRRVEVKHLIEDGDIIKAQSLINLYYPEFLDNHRKLYFKLQQQHLIELIRKQKINDVLTYVHEQLSVDELRDLTEMERTLALLAYEQPDKSPYAGLLHVSHRLQLASEINDVILQESTGCEEPSPPRLVTLLKLLFWTQSELERKKAQFSKMTDLVNGTLEPRLQHS